MGTLTRPEYGIGRAVPTSRNDSDRSTGVHASSTVAHGSQGTFGSVRICVNPCPIVLVHSRRLPATCHFSQYRPSKEQDTLQQAPGFVLPAPAALIGAIGALGAHQSQGKGDDL